MERKKKREIGVKIMKNLWFINQDCIFINQGCRMLLHSINLFIESMKQILLNFGYYKQLLSHQLFYKNCTCKSKNCDKFQHFLKVAAIRIFKS